MSFRGILRRCCTALLLLSWAARTALSQATHLDTNGRDNLVIFNTTLLPRIEEGETVVWRRNERNQSSVVVHVVGKSTLDIDGTLIIENGVRVVFHSKVNGLRVNGKLRILGRESCSGKAKDDDSCPRVVLEALPKSLGGDGYWSGIEYTSRAEAARYEHAEDGDGGAPPRYVGGGSIIQHATVRKAYIRVSVNGAPYIVDSVVEECVGRYRFGCIHGSYFVNNTLVVENTTISRRREQSDTLSIRGSRNGKVFLVRCNVSNHVAFYGPDLEVNIFRSLLNGSELRLSGINALILQDNEIRGGGDIVGSNLAMNKVGGDVRPADLPTITIRRNVFHSGSTFRCVRCRRLVFQENTMLGGHRSFFLSRVSRSLIEKNLWDGNGDEVQHYESDFLSIHVASGPFSFSDNVITNMKAGVFAKLLKSPKSRGTVEFRRNLISDSSFSQGLLHIRSPGWFVTRNIFTNTTSPVSVSVADSGLRTSILSVPENHWGLLQADIASGRRRTVLGDALGQLEGPLVDFETVLVHPSFKKKRLRPAPLPTGLVRRDGSIGGLLRDGEFELRDRPNAVASLSLVVLNATLRIGPNVQLRFVNGGGIFIAPNSSIVVDGGPVEASKKKNSFRTSVQLLLPPATTTRWWLLRVDAPTDIDLRGVTLKGGGISHDSRKGRIFLHHVVLETKRQTLFGISSLDQKEDNRVEITNSIVRGCTSESFYLSRSSVLIRNSTIQCMLKLALREGVTIEDSNLQRVEVSPSQAYQETGTKGLSITGNRLTAFRMWPICEARVSLVGNVFIPSNEAFSGIEESASLCRENAVHRGLVFHDNIVMMPFRIKFDDPHEVVSVKNNVFRNIQSLHHNYALQISYRVSPSSSAFPGPRGMDVSGNVFDGRKLSLGSTRFTTEWNIVEIDAWPSEEECQDVICSMRNNTFLRKYTKEESDPFKLYNVFVQLYPNQLPNDNDVLDITHSYWNTNDPDQIANYIGNGGGVVQYLPFRRTRSHNSKDLFPTCARVNDCRSHGICNDEETCICRDGWTGQFCGTRSDEEEPGE